MVTIQRCKSKCSKLTATATITAAVWWFCTSSNESIISVNSLQSPIIVPQLDRPFRQSTTRHFNRYTSTCLFATENNRGKEGDEHVGIDMDMDVGGISIENKKRAIDSDTDLVYIRFSRCFQRHVVFKCRNDDSCSHQGCDNGEVMGSFMFLDDAMQSFPNAKLVKLKDDDEGGMGLSISGASPISSTKVKDKVAGSGTDTDTDTDTDTSSMLHKSLKYLISLTLIGQRKPLQLPQITQTISPRRFASHTPETIHRNVCICIFDNLPYHCPCHYSFVQLLIYFALSLLHYSLFFAMKSFITKNKQKQ